MSTPFPPPCAPGPDPLPQMIQGRKWISNNILSSLLQKHVNVMEEMARHPLTGDLFFVVSDKEVFLPLWRSGPFSLSPQCGRKNRHTEQAGENEGQGQLGANTGFSVNRQPAFF